MADAARRFAQQKLKPGYRARESAGRIERAVVQEMGALGFLGAELPQAQGGLGADCVTSGLLLEQISAGDFNVGYINLLVSLCGQIIARHAAPETAREWLPRVIAGTALPALALTEPSVRMPPSEVNSFLPLRRAARRSCENDRQERLLSLPDCRRTIVGQSVQCWIRRSAAAACPSRFRGNRKKEDPPCSVFPRK